MSKDKKTAAFDAVTSGILSEEDVKKAKARALAKVQTQKRKMAEDAVYEEELRTLEIKEGLVEVDPNEEIQEVTVDLGEFADRIKLDNTIYMHGGTYKVRKSVADVLREISARSWKHEAKRHGEIGTRAADIFKPRNTRIGPKTMVNAPRPFA